jgi:hypothetical protein
MTVAVGYDRQTLQMAALSSHHQDTAHTLLGAEYWEKPTSARLEYMAKRFAGACDVEAVDLGLDSKVEHWTDAKCLKRVTLEQHRRCLDRSSDSRQAHQELPDLVEAESACEARRWFACGFHSRHWDHVVVADNDAQAELLLLEPAGSGLDTLGEVDVDQLG